MHSQRHDGSRASRDSHPPAPEDDPETRFASGTHEIVRLDAADENDDADEETPLPTSLMGDEWEVVEVRRVDDQTVVFVRQAERRQQVVREEDMIEIVHDLKSPLGAIALEADLLAHRLESGAGDACEAVARIAHNATFLDRMVQDLLDLCSLDAGHLALHREPTDLGELLLSAVARVVPSAQRHRVSLDVNRRVVLSIDDLRIERVVANFVENALKYASPRSHIHVRLDETLDGCRVSVQNDGPDLSATEMRYVFEKFRRTPSATAHPGFGLGLYVSKRIVEAHGGRIGVDSGRGTGTCFYFELPAH